MPAARWAEQHAPRRWAPLIRWALATRHDPTRHDPTRHDAMLPATLDFVRYTLAQAER